MMRIKLLILVTLVSSCAYCQFDSAISDRSVPSLTNILTVTTAFSQQLQRAEHSGLLPEDYDAAFIKEIAEGCFPANQDSTVIKNRILTAMYHYYEDLFFGEIPLLSFNGLRYNHKTFPVTELVNQSSMEGLFHEILTKYEVKNEGYTSLLKMAGDLSDSVSDAAGKRLIKRKWNAVRRALQTVRWMNALLLQNEYTVVVNIPSASLLLFRRDKVILESRVIVGKRSTRTPPLASTLTDVTIYPYWNVPKSIATKELLPEIKKDITYLERNSMQVLDKNGYVISEYAVPWKNLSEQNFPYTIRQSTGCDNSLGLIKLNILNPFNVYLHDTPWKALFEATHRYYSHGCVRVEKVKEIAHVLLGKNSIAVDTLVENESLLERAPSVLPLKEKVPTLILYNTAWFDQNATVKFYPDIYSWYSKE